MARVDATPSPPPDTSTPVRLSIVIPVHNEAGNIQPLHDELHAIRTGALQGYQPLEVLWVEDGSTDGTARIVGDLASRDEHTRAIHLRRSWGQSAALAAGFDHARGDIVVPMDGDGQNDPADIPRLVSRLEAGYDCVSGRRTDRDDPWHKTIPSAIQTHLAKLTGPSINDYGCTLKAYRREALDDIDLYGDGHRYIPSKLYDKGYTVTELAVNHRPRTHGQSRYGAGRLLRGLVDLFYHWFWVHYSTRPIHFFGALGLFALAAGGALGIVSLVQRYAYGVALATKTPRLILTSLLIIFGVQLVVFGVIAEMLTALHYRDDTEYRVQRVVD